TAPGRRRPGRTGAAAPPSRKRCRGAANRTAMSSTPPTCTNAKAWAGAAARPGTSGSGRSRRRGSPTTTRRRPPPGPLPVRARPGGCRARRSRTRFRSRRSPSWRGTSGRRGRANRWRTTLGAVPPVLRDRDELLHGRVELLGGGAVDPRAQHPEDLRVRPPVDEDDETEAEPTLVLGVQPRELGQRLGSGGCPLPRGG